MKTMLVTGGAGFIGSHVADQLLALGHRVVVLDDFSGGFEDNVPSGAVLARGSILDVDLIERLFSTHRFDAIYHLAAYAAEGLSHFIKRFNYLNNLVGSVNLINAAVNHGVGHFVFTSSIAVYGAGQSPMTEELTPVPEDPYGIAKLAVERELAVSHEMFGLNYTIFRPHNVYGERQNIGDRYRNVVGIFMNQILKGEPMTIFGNGEQKRAFSHIDDVAPVIARCLDVPGAKNQIFNVGADDASTVNHLAQVVAAAFGVTPNIRYLAARNEVQVAFSDHNKIQNTFGHTTPVTLEAGIGQMAKWAKQHGSRASTIFDPIEIRKNLPPSWAAASAQAK